MIEVPEGYHACQGRYSRKILCDQSANGDIMECVPICKSITETQFNTGVGIILFIIAIVFIFNRKYRGIAND